MTQETNSVSANSVIANGEESLTTNLQDLIIPAETSLFDSVLTGALILFLIIGLILFGFMFKRCRKSQQVVKRKIKALQRGADKSNQSKQETAQQLSTLLQTGLGVTQLEQYKPQESTNWEEFTENLTAICYSKSEPTDEALKNLFEQSYVWLENA